MQNTLKNPEAPTTQELDFDLNYDPAIKTAVTCFVLELFGESTQTPSAVSNLLAELRYRRDPPLDSCGTTSDPELIPNLKPASTHCNVARPTLPFPVLEETEVVLEIEPEAEQTDEERKVATALNIIRNRLSRIGSLSIDAICQFCPKTIIGLVFEALLEELNNKYKVVDRSGQVYTVDRIVPSGGNYDQIYLRPESSKAEAYQTPIYTSNFRNNFWIKAL